MFHLEKPVYADREYKKRTFPLYRGALSQLFGENLNDFYRQMGLLGHNGLDMPCPTGTQIFAAHDGKVIKRSLSETAGLGITLITNDTYPYEGRPVYFSTIYWHLSKLLVGDNQQVKRGELIGISGNTGQYTTGAHLHFGLAPRYEKDNRYYKLYPTNGFGGYIDPLPFIETMKVNKALLRLIYLSVFKREPDEAAQGYIGQSVEFVLIRLLESPENKAYTKLYSAGKEIEKL